MPSRPSCSVQSPITIRLRLLSTLYSVFREWYFAIPPGKFLQKRLLLLAYRVDLHEKQTNGFSLGDTGPRGPAQPNRCPSLSLTLKRQPHRTGADQVAPMPSFAITGRKGSRLYRLRPASTKRTAILIETRRLSFALRCVLPMILLLAPAGCLRPDAPPPQGSDSLDVDEILERCVQNYTEMTTFSARGILRDCRSDVTLPIEWDYIRPNHMRLQLGVKLALVDGRDWWTYTEDQPRFRKHRRFTSTPLRTTAHLLSGGVPLFLPAVFETGRRAFGDRGAGWFDRWTFQKVDWRDEFPCYVLDNRNPPGLPNGMLRLWIDQDRFWVRGWVVSAIQPGGRVVPVWECTYTQVEIDGSLAADRFRLIEPRPRSHLAQTDPLESE